MNDERRSTAGSLVAGAAIRGAGAILSWKVILAAALAALLVLLVCLGAGALAMFGTVATSSSTADLCSPGGAGVHVEGTDGKDFQGYTAEQLDTAAIVLDTAGKLGVGRQGQLIALITVMQESTLGVNTQPTGNGNDAGPFQQRTLPGWYGTLEQVQDVQYATTAFIQGVDIDYAGPGSAGPAGYHIPGLVDLKGWESMDPGEAAQAVQISDYPSAYMEHVSDAQAIMDHLAGASVSESSDAGGATAADCTGGGSGEALNATTMDQLPHYPMPAGCTDQTPQFSEYGPNTLNGDVPDSALCSYPGALDADGRGQPRAVAAYVAMNKDFKKQFGHDLQISSTYRTFAKQQETKVTRGYLAATPGWSNHGFGLAIDIRGTYDEKRWIQQNGPSYGWWHPTWARTDGRKPEDWHYEYGTWLVASEYKDIDTSLIAY
ncbi:hypothetical protein GCM10028787_32990 [Brachybacterium horti]|uniref:M15 family metallopeptidase n=1 Tax=Brachybacterium rhamnosum TaxID=173361 RepID=A0ABW4Q285_9MICO